jgi:hypothetical protein
MAAGRDIRGASVTNCAERVQRDCFAQKTGGPLPARPQYNPKNELGVFAA